MTIDLLPDRMVVEEGHFDDHTDDADDSGESSWISTQECCIHLVKMDGCDGSTRKRKFFCV